MQTGKKTSKKRIIYFSATLVFIFFAFTIIISLYHIQRMNNLTVEFVVTSNNEFLEEVAIDINNENLVTNNQGIAKLENVQSGKYTADIEKPGYENIILEIEISPSIFNYDFSFNVELKNSSQASIKGRLITSEGFEFLNEKLQIDGVDITIEPNGEFILNDIESGNNNLIFESPNFLDFNRTINLLPGTNNIDQINLQPAADAIGETSSYLSDSLVTNFEIFAENINSNQINTKEGNLYIKDLEIGRKYFIEINHPDYLKQELNITPSQGLNELFGLEFIEKLPVALQQKENKSDLLQIMYPKEQLLRTVYKGNNDIFAEEIIDDYVYFLSTRDNIRSKLGGRSHVPYFAPIETGNPQRMVSDTTNFGRIIPGFSVGKIINIYREGTGSNITYYLESIDLKTEERTEILSGKNYLFGDVLVADRANRAAFYVQDINDESNGLYVANLDTGENQRLTDRNNLLLYDISPNGDKVLYTAEGDNSSNINMYEYTVSTRSERLLIPSYRGNQYQYLDNENILFFDLRDNGSNVFVFNTKVNEKSRLTSFSGLEGVEAVYQQNGLILYQTNVRIYAMLPENPLPNKIITSNFIRYSGYDF